MPTRLHPAITDWRLATRNTTSYAADKWQKYMIMLAGCPFGREGKKDLDHGMMIRLIVGSVTHPDQSTTSREGVMILVSVR